MKDHLAELKDACRDLPSRSEKETIARGESSWFRGVPARASEGTVALAIGDAHVVIDASDIRSVKREGDQFSVEVSEEARVLVRLEKVVKATPTTDCGCNDDAPPSTMEKPVGKQKGPTIEIGKIEVCSLVCGDFYVGGIKFHVCIPVNCRIVN